MNEEKTLLEKRITARAKERLRKEVNAVESLALEAFDRSTLLFNIKGTQVSKIREEVSRIIRGCYDANAPLLLEYAEGLELNGLLSELSTVKALLEMTGE